MKHISIFLLSVMVIAAGFCTDAGAQQKKAAYEGSVSLTYCYPLHAGLETAHGVKYDKSGIFIGGIAGGMLGVPLGSFVYAGFLPRWFADKWEKYDLFISCAVTYYNMTPYRGSAVPPDMMPSKNYMGGVGLIPEIGFGFKLNNGDAIDIALRYNTCFVMYDSFKDYYAERGKSAPKVVAYPGLSIGYRF